MTRFELDPPDACLQLPGPTRGAETRADGGGDRGLPDTRQGLPEDGGSTPLQPIRIPLLLTYTHYKTPGKGRSC